MLKKNIASFIEFDEVFNHLVQQAQAKRETQVKQETVSLHNALDRVLAKAIYAPINMPPWRQAAMDGYAYCSETDETWLSIGQPIYAGDALKSASHQQTNRAVAIMTGAPVPEDLDTIVPIEQSYVKKSSQKEGSAYLLKPENSQPNKHIRETGSEIAKGERLLSAGQKIGAKELALLASVGIQELKVFARIQVVLFTTGNELVRVGGTLEQGQIYDANSWLISALCQTLPIELLAIEHLTDDEMTTQKKLEDWGTKSDIILTLGGASKGDKDQIKHFLTHQPKADIWQLNMRPAKPFATIALKRAQLLALPGNPLAAFMSFQLLAKPFIKTLAGLNPLKTNPQKAPLLTPFENKANRVEWLQVSLSSQGLSILNHRTLGQLSCLTQADGYIRINPLQSYQAGDQIQYWSHD